MSTNKEKILPGKKRNHTNRIEKNAKDWWQFSNQLKNRKFTIGNALTVERYANYFSSLLNPPLISPPMQYAKSVMN